MGVGELEGSSDLVGAGVHNFINPALVRVYSKREVPRELNNFQSFWKVSINALLSFSVGNVLNKNIEKFLIISWKVYFKKMHKMKKNC